MQWEQTLWGKMGNAWQASRSKITSQNADLFVCLLLAFTTIALYSPCIGHPFMTEWDDDCYVTSNPQVQAGMAWKTVLWAMTTYECGNWHPLTWLSHALDYEVFGSQPYGHHLTSVLLHAVNGMLLYLLLRRATAALGKSLLVAALFAIHPFNVESVVWVAERKNLLSTFFFLLALGSYGWYCRKPSIQRYAALMTFFAFGVASKPMVITLPCVLLLLDYWPLQRIRGGGIFSQQRLVDGIDNQRRLPRALNPATASSLTQFPLSRLVREKLPLFAISGASAVMTVLAQNSYHFVQIGIPLRLRLKNAVYSYAAYGWKALWPSNLAAYYPHPLDTLGWWHSRLAALFLASVSVLVWQQRRHRPYLLMGWLWFLVTLVPMIGIVQVGGQAMADRYAYIPLIGIFVMVIWGAADLPQIRQLGFGLRTAAVAVVFFVLALQTHRQIEYWRDSYDLWSHTLDVTTNNDIGEEKFGMRLLGSGRTTDAVQHLQEAARLSALPRVHLELAYALVASNRPQDAIVQFETALSLAPAGAWWRALIYEVVGRLYYKIGDYSKSRASYRQALRINPHQLTADERLANEQRSDAPRDGSNSR